MKYLMLIGAGLKRRRLRTLLTVLAVAVAFLLFGVMHGVVSSFDSALDRMSDTRLRVMSRANLLETIPISYRERMLQVEGVNAAVPFVIFIAYYQDPVNGVNAIGLDVREFVGVLPELTIPAEALQALDETRTGAIAGVLLAERYGWKVGDRVPLKSLMWVNEETGQDWVFDIVGIANGGEDDDQLYGQELYFHYAYLDEARRSGKGRVHQFILGIDEPARAEQIAAEVDALFANSSDETTTLNEKQYVQNQLQQIGDIQSFVYYILAAVLFALLFMTATNMMQSIRERISELGIMRALGFAGGTLAVVILLESTVLCIAGAMVGLGLASTVFPSVFAGFGIDGMQLDTMVYLQGLALAVLLALLGSAWPAWRAGSLDVVDAIAGEHRG